MAILWPSQNQGGLEGRSAPPAKSLFSPLPAPLGFQPSTWSQEQSGEGLKKSFVEGFPLHTTLSRRDNYNQKTYS